MLNLGILTTPSYCHGNRYQVDDNGLIILLHTKSSRYYNVPGKCLEVLGRGIIDRMRKGKEKVCNACMCYDLLGTFYVDEEVFLLLCMEGSSVFFQQKTWQLLLTSAVT